MSGLAGSLSADLLKLRKRWMPYVLLLVMLAGAAQAYANRWAVKPGRRAVVLTNNDSGYGAALDLRDAGVEIAAVVGLRQNPDGALTDRAESSGIRVMAEHGIVSVQGKLRVEGVKVAPLAAGGQGIGQPVETLACDLVLNAGGFTPTVHLFSQARGKLQWDESRQWFRPGTPGPASAMSTAPTGLTATMTDAPSAKPGAGTLPSGVSAAPSRTTASISLRPEKNRAALKSTGLR